MIRISRRFLRRVTTVAVSLFIVSSGLPVYAQDAGIVLRMLVGYRTQRATLQLTDAQKQQADELARQAQDATRAQKYGDALRYYYQGLAVMRNAEWTPALELATSLQGRLDHALLEPGKPVTIELKPLFTSPHGAEVNMTASVYLMPGAQSLGPKQSVDSKALPFKAPVTVPEIAPGNYTLEVRLAADGATAANPFVKSLPIHVEALSGEASRVRTRLANITQKNSATNTAAYALTLYDLADRGEVNPNQYKLREELAAAGSMLDALEAGKDPFAAKRGDFRKAYRSGVDNTLQPYRVFIPDSYRLDTPGRSWWRCMEWAATRTPCSTSTAASSNAKPLGWALW
jgi:hypothetical protein